MIAAQVAWPLEDSASLKNEAITEMQAFAEHLKNELLLSNTDNHPEIETTAIVGEMSKVINDLSEQKKASLVIMGMSGHGAIGQMVFGSNARVMIDASRYPVLLVPPKYVFKPIQKIAFATDLDIADVELLQSVANFARYFNAEILLAHITKNEHETGNDRRKTEDFLCDISSKNIYPKIYYRHVKGHSVEQGLNWLNEHGDVDILVIIHRKAGFFSRFFEGSHTQKMATQSDLPLLILPSNSGLIYF